MNAGELFKAGKLHDAIDAQIKEVKSNPADQNKRMFLFELIAFTGDLERARKQLEALTYAEVELESSRQQYRQLLEAEALRRQVFAAGQKPHFLIDPPEHVTARLEALEHLRNQRPAEATAILMRANASAPQLAGTLNGKAFAGLRDYDELFWTVLEVMSKGIYAWVPLEQVVSVVCVPPRFPRDLLWFPARLELRDGSNGEVFLPVLYPNSHAETDELVQVGQVTDWKMSDDGPTLGVGQHQFLAGDAPVALPAWRDLQIDEK
jgi:type VI secretion system protein ImpE